MKVSIGDPVEVRAIVMDEGETWVPGTVCALFGGRGIGVAFSDATRMAVPNGEWQPQRPARPAAPDLSPTD